MLNSLKNELQKIQKKVIEFKNVISLYNRVIILGNGGSNSIASHIAQDYTKALGKKAISFSDGSRLTCYINDYGWDEAYVKFIEHFYESNTMVILISSSGESANIVNAAKYCRKQEYPYMALSGFSKQNKLNKYPCHFRYHVDSDDYGIVEISHLTMLHTVLSKEEKTGIVAGAFDVIHPGYVRLFENAKKYCSHLTVALHKDPSLERKEKPSPVHTVEERKEILLAMKNVDKVVVYSEERVFHEHLKTGKYDVRFLGTDYKDRQYSGKDIPIDIVWVDRDHNYSTTLLKEKISHSVIKGYSKK